MNTVRENSPICFFSYCRLNETIQSIEALAKNPEAINSDLFVFNDGPRCDADYPNVMIVRKYLQNITGFKSVSLRFSETNKGLSKSIISGVSDIISRYGHVIVIEDDVVAAENFLSFMNKAIRYFEHWDRVWSISGYSYPIDYPDDYPYDVSFGLRASSWGWATWEDRWLKVDWELRHYEEFMKNRINKKKFNRGGSDMTSMLRDQMKGKIDTWGIRFCFSQFLHDSYDVFPKTSKVKNIGFGSGAVHTKNMSRRFDTVVDQSKSTEFKFPDSLIINQEVLEKFRRKFSILNRLKYRALSYIP